jgi:CBS domain-containing protein
MATKIAEVMSDRPRAVTEETPVREAVRLMEEEDVGSLPVVRDGARLVGIVTDRDVALRVVGRGLDPETTHVGEIASTDLVAVTPEQDLDKALELMAREQVRRLPVIAGENELVGMLAQADLARLGKDKDAGQVVDAISQPPRGPRVSGDDEGGSSATRLGSHGEERRDD